MTSKKRKCPARMPIRAELSLQRREGKKENGRIAFSYLRERKRVFKKGIKKEPLIR